MIQRIVHSLIFTLILLCSGQVFAQDSSMFFNADRVGEGIVLLRGEDDRMVFFFFTFGHEQCFEIAPKVSPAELELDCDQNGQRWFFGSETYDPVLDQIKGELFIVDGQNYPEGIMDPFDPFVQNVGKAEVVGEFTLRRGGNGWRLFVDQDGTERLHDGDVLYEAIWEFQDLLFRGGN